MTNEQISATIADIRSRESFYKDYPIVLELTSAVESLQRQLADRVESSVDTEIGPAMPADPTLIKCHVNACISALRDEDGRSKTRELSLAVTKLQEAAMWIDEHQRFN